MRHSIQHNLSPELLRLAVGKFAEVYGERFKEYHANVVWLSERELEVCFKVSGIALSSRLQLEAKALTIAMDVPLAFRIFKGRAMRAIEEEVRPWLEAAAKGELK